MSKELVEKLAKDIGGTIEEMQALPDGSGFAVMSMPLPKDHWLLKDGFNEPPAPWRMGNDDPRRKVYADALREAGRYAVRAATMNGKEIDFDPDALIQNLVVGMLGYGRTTDFLTFKEPHMEHVKDCIRLVPGNGGTDRADHAALEDITQPRPDQVWRTAYMEIKAMREAALENYTNDPSDYNRGRMNALGDASERLLERWVKA